MEPAVEKKPIARRPVTWIVAGVTLLFLVAVVAPFIYINFIQDEAPERLTFEDVPSNTTGSTGATTDSTAATDTSDGPDNGSASSDSLDGMWTIAEGSQAGYRAKEVLFGQDAEAVGRTSDVTGELAIDGTVIPSASFEVDLTTLESDESRRDGQVQNRILETAQFPTATFELTEPIELDAIPADLEEITVEATGDLTLHGTTNTATFELSARRNGANIEVNGLIPVTLSEYDIPDASGGPATVGDDVEIEFLLVFEPA